MNSNLHLSFKNAKIKINQIDWWDSLLIMSNKFSWSIDWAKYGIDYQINWSKSHDGKDNIYFHIFNSYEFLIKNYEVLKYTETKKNEENLNDAYLSPTKYEIIVLFKNFPKNIVRINFSFVIKFKIN